MIHSYPWYISDWRSSEAVLAMNLEQRGLYRELLDHCWETGSLPIDAQMLKKISHSSDKEWKRCWPLVAKQFIEIDGRLHHPKVDEKRRELEYWRESKREAGRQGAAKRWHGTTNSTPNGSAIGKSWPSTTTTTTTTSSSSPTTTNVVAPGHPEFPEAAAALRERFPETDDSFIMRLTIAIGQKVAGLNGKAKGDPSDSLIARAIRHCTKSTPRQNSAGLYLKTVPQTVATWLTQGEPSETGNPIFNPDEYGI